MKHALLPTTALLALLVSACTKDDPDPASQLPPATQTGANTFGCLLNGQPWAPVGNGTSRNFFIDYDTGYPGGLFSLEADKYLNNSPGGFQLLTIYARPLPTVGSYDLGDLVHTRVVFSNPSTSCSYESRDTDTSCQGTLTITRLDTQARIISGTFSATATMRSSRFLKVETAVGT